MAQDYGYAGGAGAYNPREAITDALMRIQRPPPAPPYQQMSGGMFGQAPTGTPSPMGAPSQPGMPGAMPPGGLLGQPALPGMLPSPLQAAGAATPGGVVANAASPYPRPY
jgi:hypothetical protein